MKDNYIYIKYPIVNERISLNIKALIKGIPTLELDGDIITITDRNFTQGLKQKRIIDGFINSKSINIPTVANFYSLYRSTFV